MAVNASNSIVKACGTSTKIQEAYRLIRHEKISPDEIANAGFKHTQKIIPQKPLVLAV
jgi:hypothetical protein